MLRKGKGIVVEPPPHFLIEVCASEHDLFLTQNSIEIIACDRHKTADPTAQQMPLSYSGTGTADRVSKVTRTENRMHI